jgi:hypothetical protein
MRIKIVVIGIVLGLMACSTGDDAEIRHADLVGKWNWVRTDGGIGFHIHETPETTGKTVQVTLNGDYTYSISENEQKVSSGIWQLSMKESIYSGEEERYIIFCDDYQDQNVVISGIIYSLEKDTLMIGDNYHDGVSSRYSRE